MVLGGVGLAIVVAVLACEALGWPFLVGPMQQWLSKTLARRVSFAGDASTRPVVRIGLLGSIRIDAGYFEIGAPGWSNAPHMLLARDVHLRLGYWDLWRAHKGEPLHIRELEAASLDGQLERTADGRASWQFGATPPAATAASAPPRIPSFGTLEVAQGTLGYRDAPLTMELDADFSLLEHGGKTSTTTASASAPAAAASGAVPAGLQFHGNGKYLRLPFKVDASTIGALPFVSADAAAVALPVSIDAVVGRARMSFRGTATDAVHLGGLKGSFSIMGPSLAAMGDPLRVTLPTTGPFKADGVVAKTGLVWNVVLSEVAIGSSQLDGAFTYDPRRGTPLLSGRLGGRRLALADLGPAVGGSVQNSAKAPAAASAASASRKGGKVIPDREFDLPSLRAMNANVLVDIADFDLGSRILEPLKPMKLHLVLDQGVLALQDIDARTGQGTLGGALTLDGRTSQALWNADLRWDNVRLQQWIHQTRKDGAPPYLTGNLDGRLRVDGQGKSTATILGSLKGEVRMHVVDGTVSHLAIEAAGLDIAQALGVFVKGDNSLPMQCAVADLVADHGQLRPRVMVVDTTDSVVWVDGSLSLASEALDLRLLVSPKDFSPFALRTPIKVKGSFGDPSVSLEAGKLAGRTGAAAALLAFVNPIAAVIPFFDKGSTADAQRGQARCDDLMKRIQAHPALPAPEVSAQAARAAASAAAAGDDKPPVKPRGAPGPLIRLGHPSSR